MADRDLRAVLERVKERVHTSCLIVEHAQTVVRQATDQARRSLIFDEFCLLAESDGEEGVVSP